MSSSPVSTLYSSIPGYTNLSQDNYYYSSVSSSDFPACDNSSLVTLETVIDGTYDATASTVGSAEVNALCCNKALYEIMSDLEKTTTYPAKNEDMQSIYYSRFYRIMFYLLGILAMIVTMYRLNNLFPKKVTSGTKAAAAVTAAAAKVLADQSPAQRPTRKI